MGSTISDLYTMDADVEALPAANPPAPPPPVLPNLVAGIQPNPLDIVQELGQGEGNGEVGITSGAQVVANVAGSSCGSEVKAGEAEVAPEIPKATTVTADHSDLSGGGNSVEVLKPQDQLRTQDVQVQTLHQASHEPTSQSSQVDLEAMAEKVKEKMLQDQVIRSMIDDAVKDYFATNPDDPSDDSDEDLEVADSEENLDVADSDENLDVADSEEDLEVADSEEDLEVADSDENLEVADSDENLADGEVEDDDDEDDEDGERQNTSHKRGASSSSRQNSSAKKTRRVSSNRSSAGRRGRNKGQAPTRQSARIRNAKNNRKK